MISDFDGAFLSAGWKEALWHRFYTEETEREAQLIRVGHLIFLVGPMRLQTRLGAYYALHLGAFTQALYRKISGLIVIAD